MGALATHRILPVHVYAVKLQACQERHNWKERESSAPGNCQHVRCYSARRLTHAPSATRRLRDTFSLAAAEKPLLRPLPPRQSRSFVPKASRPA